MILESRWGTAPVIHLESRAITPDAGNVGFEVLAPVSDLGFISHSRIIVSGGGLEGCFIRRIPVRPHYLCGLRVAARRVGLFFGIPVLGI